MFFKHILFTYFGRIRSDCSFDIFLSFFFHSRFGQGGNRLRMRVIFKPITAKLSSHLFCAERAAHASSKHKMADGAFLRGDGLSGLTPLIAGRGMKIGKQWFFRGSSIHEWAYIL